MSSTLIFPVLLIVLDIGASVMYAIDGNWRLTVYWFAAATLTAMVTI